MIENEDYQFIDVPQHPDKYGVKLLSGQFKDVIYDYGTVSFHEDVNEESCKMTYDVDVCEFPESFASKEEVENNKTFHNITGDILVNILKEGQIKTENPHGEA